MIINPKNSKSIDGPIDVDTTSPDLIIAQKQELLQKAISKLVGLGLSEEEARALAGSE